MRYTTRLFVPVFCLFACLAVTAPVWGQQTPPAIYVSGSTGILSIGVGSNVGTVSPLVTNSATYQGLVIGPDNNTTDNTGNPAHPYLLYACDPTNDTIIRFDPNDVPAGTDTVYSGGGLDPQCGRFTNTGDLIVTSSVAGSGIWEITSTTPGQHLADVGLGAGVGSFTTVQVPLTATGQLGAGIAQKNTGGLLTVDLTNKDVILTPYVIGGSFNGPMSVYVKASSSVIPAPFGIAKLSDGEIFVSSQSTGSKTSNTIAHFKADGSGGTQCIDLGSKYTPFFMQMTADDTLYVATSASSGGVVYSLTYNGRTCSATAVATNGKLPSTLVGIALPPTTVSRTVKNFSANQIFNFNFAAFEFNSTSCTLTVTAMPENLAVIDSYIANAVANDPGNLGFGAVPAVDLGRDGFETAFQFDSSSCAPDLLGQNSDGLNAEFLAAQIDNQLVPNPRVLHCDANCAVVETFGDYPLGGLLPLDTTLSGRDSGSVHFLVSENTGNSSEPGTFCGFQTPLTNTPPPGIAGVFSSGQTLSLKFELAQGANNLAGCQNGPFITDATALLSVAQIFDNHGNPVFIPNTAIDASGNSTPVQPIFKNDPTNKQYQFSLSLKNYAKGIYSLTITFLSSNTSFQVAEIQVQ